MEIELNLVPQAIPADQVLSPKIRNSKSHKQKKTEGKKEKNISAVIHQDIGALRNRKGDTGTRLATGRSDDLGRLTGASRFRQRGLES